MNLELTMRNALRQLIVVPIVLVTSVILLTANVQASGGSGGNEFGHWVNPRFDFHFATPPDWNCNDCSVVGNGDGKQAGRSMAVQENSVTWHATAPEKTTWMKVTFISEFPAVNDKELLEQLKGMHPDIDWRDIERADFVGFTSSFGGARDAIEYYLVDKVNGTGNVIKIEWYKDESLPNRSHQLDLIKKSIDRNSRGPRIISIQSDKKQAYKVGERACIHIVVDDLKDGFQRADISSFEINGALPHWSFKSIEYVGKKGRFDVCFKVLPSFTKDALQIKRLHLQSMSCAASAEDAVSCIYGGEETVIQTLIADVENPSPDISGPDIQSITMDQSSKNLSIQARDSSGVALIELTYKSFKQIIFPDQIGDAIPVHYLVPVGWNTISHIIVVDNNGYYCSLHLEEGSKHGQVSKKNKMPSKEGAASYYLQTCTGQEERRSDIEVISFFK